MCNVGSKDRQSLCWSKNEIPNARKIREIRGISQHDLLVLLHFYITIFGQEMILPPGG